jgi:diacylglycerol kinase (ATP)
MTAHAPPRRALLVRNPCAKQGADPAQAAIARLTARGVAVTRMDTGSREAMAAEIARRAGQFDCIVAAGGDGTANALAPAVLEAGVPLGVLPLGTANDLARTLDIPFDVEAAADVIAEGRRRTIDVGMANDIPFFNVASIGLSAELVSALGHQTKQRLGRWGYVFAAAKVLTSAQTFRAVIATPAGALRVKSYQIAVGNGRYYGGGVAVRPDAAIDDALLDLYSLGRGGLWKVVATAPLFKRGRHGLFREVKTARGRRLEIRTTEPMPVNLDGELATETPVVIEVKPRAMEVFAPDVG